MNNSKSENKQAEQPLNTEGTPTKKRAYLKPSISSYGRVGDVTHGPSVGSQESTNPAFFKA